MSRVNPPVELLVSPGRSLSEQRSARLNAARAEESQPESIEGVSRPQEPLLRDRASRQDKIGKNDAMVPLLALGSAISKRKKGAIRKSIGNYLSEYCQLFLTAPARSTKTLRQTSFVVCVCTGDVEDAHCRSEAEEASSDLYEEGHS